MDYSTAKSLSFTGCTAKSSRSYDGGDGRRVKFWRSLASASLKMADELRLSQDGVARRARVTSSRVGVGWWRDGSCSWGGEVAMVALTLFEVGGFFY